jgi:hypothetical protein
VHLAHAAATEQLLDPVALDVRAGGRVAGGHRGALGASLPDRGRACKRGRGRRGLSRLRPSGRPAAVPPCRRRRA